MEQRGQSYHPAGLWPDVPPSIKPNRLCAIVARRSSWGLKVSGAAVLQPRAADIPAANLLQVTWEHMAVLSQEGLGALRDILLRCLGQHWRWTHPVREAEDAFPLPLVSSSSSSLDIFELMPCRHKLQTCPGFPGCQTLVQESSHVYTAYAGACCATQRHARARQLVPSLDQHC